MIGWSAIATSCFAPRSPHTDDGSAQTEGKYAKHRKTRAKRFPEIQQCWIAKTLFRYTELFRYTKLFSVFGYRTRGAKTTEKRFCVAFRVFRLPSAAGITTAGIPYFAARPDKYDKVEYMHVRSLGFISIIGKKLPTS